MVQYLSSSLELPRDLSGERSAGEAPLRATRGSPFRAGKPSKEVRALPALISISLRAVRPVIHLRSGPIFSLFRLILVSCVSLARGDISVTLLASSSK